MIDLSQPRVIDLPNTMLGFHNVVEQGLHRVLAKAHEHAGHTRTRAEDQNHPIIRAFYQAFNAAPRAGGRNPYKARYKQLVDYVAHDLLWIGQSALYQAVPACRVQQPGHVAVGEWHKDTLNGHSEHEINVFVPLWDTVEANTIHINTGDGPTAYPLKRGQVLLFMGGLWEHSNVINTSWEGRVSFDFRLLRRQHYVPGGASIKGARTFELGSYWLYV